MWDGTERRKGRMPPDNFTPNGAFEGYVFARLEDIAKQFTNLPCGESSKRLGKVENKIANIEGKAGVIGAIAGIVAAWVGKYIFGK